VALETPELRRNVAFPALAAPGGVACVPKYKLLDGSAIFLRRVVQTEWIDADCRSFYHADSFAYRFMSLIVDR
jgi:hypothetical protein